MNMSSVLWIAVEIALATAVSTGQVTTSQYDNARTGASLSGKLLTPENVNARQFGRLGAFKVDGPVYAQPLFLPDVEIPGKGTHRQRIEPAGRNRSGRSSLIGERLYGISRPAPR